MLGEIKVTPLPPWPGERFYVRGIKQFAYSNSLLGMCSRKVRDGA